MGGGDRPRVPARHSTSRVASGRPGSCGSRHRPRGRRALPGCEGCPGKSESRIRRSPAVRGVGLDRRSQGDGATERGAGWIWPFVGLRVGPAFIGQSTTRPGRVRQSASGLGRRAQGPIRGSVPARAGAGKALPSPHRARGSRRDGRSVVERLRIRERLTWPAPPRGASSPPRRGRRSSPARA